MKNDAVLKVTGLKIYFSSHDNRIGKAVDGIDFTINRGETIALVGESGSGKSVTALSVMRLLSEPVRVEGSVQLDENELLDLSEKQMNTIRGNQIAMIFQEPMSSLNPVYTIGMQLSEPLRKHKKMKRKEARRKAEELLTFVGFPRAKDIMNVYPHQLSGGMLQRVMIAMAVSCRPKLLIADEPTTALDALSQSEILQLTRKLQKETKAAILFITHDFEAAASIADRVMVMYGGQIVESATTRDLFTSPKHPYTKGLLRSIPKMEGKEERLDAIPGVVPSSFAFPKGCRFAPRCEHAEADCKKAVPPLENRSPGHWVRCIFG